MLIIKPIVQTKLKCKMLADIKLGEIQNHMQNAHSP